VQSLAILWQDHCKNRDLLSWRSLYKKPIDIMTTPLLICDDSLMARKQVARSLPSDWDVDITFASNGAEGLQAIRAGKGEMVFLDLTMPEVDGYQVLEAVKKEGLNAMIIVISGDIQPEAQARVTSLGAMDFIKKPVSPEKLIETLKKFGLI
jgi:two-component system chemotaxis response regulator CheY